jgi:hypothetical protein
MSSLLTMEWYDVAWIAAFFLAFYGLWMTWKTLEAQRSGSAGNTWFKQQLSNMENFFIVGNQEPVGKSYLARLEASDDKKNDGLLQVPQNIETMMGAVTELIRMQEDINQKIRVMEESVVEQGTGLQITLNAQERILDICESLDNMMGGRRK